MFQGNIMVKAARMIELSKKEIAKRISPAEQEELTALRAEAVAPLTDEEAKRLKVYDPCGLLNGENE